MLDRNELAAVAAAAAAARLEVERLERAADDADASRVPVWRWLFPSDERRAATTARAVYAAALRIRDAQIEAPADATDHEEIVRVVQMLRELATPGWMAATLRDSTLGDVAARKARELVAKLPDVGAGLARWVKVLVVVLAVVAGVAFLAVVSRWVAFLTPRRA